jgi:signal transduction histidine kinase
VKFSLDLAPALPPVLADAIMIEQVLLNLIRNAIEAMQQVAPDSRTLSIKTAPAANAMLQVSVRDSGPGIPAEVVANLYTAFFSTKEHGMGIGLNISRSIIEFHGGKLWHEPGSDRGSIFNFTLPVHPE